MPRNTTGGKAQTTNVNALEQGTNNMKKSLKINRLTVVRRGVGQYGRRTEFLPILRISGKWFEKLGFAIGQQVEIIAQGDSLLIRKGGQQ